MEEAALCCLIEVRGGSFPCRLSKHAFTRTETSRGQISLKNLDLRKSEVNASTVMTYIRSIIADCMK